MSTSFSTYDNVDILQVFFVMRDLISHVKRLTRRSCKFSDRHALKREGVLLMLRLEKIFGPLEAGAIVFHLAMIHGPEDLRWGFSQGVWCFENFWGYLGRFKTRQVNPEANIMKMHHSAQFVNAAREGSQLSEILRNHNSLEVRNLTKLFDDRRSLVKSKPSRTPGHIDETTAVFTSWRDTMTVAPTSNEEEKLRRLFGPNATSFTWRRVKRLTIGGITRVPEFETKPSARTKSHYFRLRGDKELYGTLVDMYRVEITFDGGATQDLQFIARVNVYSRPLVSRRSLLPVVRIDAPTREMIRCTDVGDLVVLATPRAASDHSQRRVVLPFTRGNFDVQA